MENTIYNNSFAERFKLMRLLRNMTQEQAAAGLNISTGSVGMWETGKRTPPLKKIYEIAGFFDCRVDFLTGESDDYTSSMANGETERRLAQEEVQKMNALKEGSYYYDLLKTIASLDDYSRKAISALVAAERDRCAGQNTLRDTDWMELRIIIKRDPDKTV